MVRGTPFRLVAVLSRCHAATWKRRPPSRPPSGAARCDPCGGTCDSMIQGVSRNQESTRITHNLVVGPDGPGPLIIPSKLGGCAPPGDSRPNARSLIHG